MSDKRQPPRAPTAFALIDDSAEREIRKPRAPAAFEDRIVMTPDEADPFLGPAADDPAVVPPLPPKRRGISFLRIALGAIGLLLSLAFGLWADQLVRDLFARADWLGYLAMAALAVAILALVVALARELAGLMSLKAVEKLREKAGEARLAPSPRPARALMAAMILHLGERPETALGRSRLKDTETDIIDGPHLVDLTERELMGALDRRARALILGSAKRVSVVTAVSPRALVDLGYVIFESARLVRAMAELYGGRPGTLGLLRLLRNVVAHLAVTGSIAVGDSLVQQILGHGLASRVSARLGEGVVNGLMTARIGIAAMDLCRPMPFVALSRPGIGDFIGDLSPGLGRKPADGN